MVIVGMTWCGLSPQVERPQLYSSFACGIFCAFLELMMAMSGGCGIR